MDTYREPARDIPVIARADVVVAGPRASPPQSQRQGRERAWCWWSRWGMLGGLPRRGS